MKVSVSTLGHADLLEECLDKRLVALREELHELANQQLQEHKGDDDVTVLSDSIAASVVKVLEDFSVFRFTGVEQIDLYCWISVLDLVDSVLHYFLQCLVVEDGVLLKVEFGANESKSLFGIKLPKQKIYSKLKVQGVESPSERSLLIILDFLSEFLRCAIHKHVFNSVEVPLILLMSKNDALHSAALRTLYSIALPPIITDLTMGHQQQHGNTQLHSIVGSNDSNGNTVAISEILLGLSRGWGTEGGIMSEVCVDDVGQRMGQLRDQSGKDTLTGGTISFEFWYHNKSLDETDHCRPTKRQQLIQFKLTPDEIDSAFPSPNSRTTSSLYFYCLDIIKQKFGVSSSEIPFNILASLVHNVRLALSYRCQMSRINAIERRLHALVISICTHRSMDVLSGYFIAQPELVADLVGLVKLIDTSHGIQTSSGTSMTIMSDGVYKSLSDHIYHSGIPFGVRKLAITALTVLITRRNSTEHNGGGTLSSVAKQTNVLSELGVGKGRYLGLLPTLIRFSLTSLVAAVSSGVRLGANSSVSPRDDSRMDVDDSDIALGLVFIEATKPPPPPPEEAEELALEFIDYLLNLTIAVVNVSSGSAALTDCGLIPALIGVIGSDLGITVQGGDNDYIRSLRKSVVSQAVQILDTAIVTHGSAFTALNELDGSNILLQRLDKEVQHIVSNSTGQNMRQVDASVRVLLYNLLNCLTVIFHQSDNTSQANTTTNTTVGGTLLRSEKLTSASLEFLRHPVEYGGLLLALTGTMLADVMNSDPTVVHHIHSSGIAQAYFELIKSDNLPASSEFIMGIPGMLGALALTSSGADTLSEQNPFEKLITTIFVTPKYCMPTSKCLLNGITAMFGTGLDELIRHVPQVKQQCVKGLAQAVKQVTLLGETLKQQEGLSDDKNNLLPERTHFIQYAQNVCQLLTHILQGSENVSPFVEAGGWETLLNLHCLLLPQDSYQFLSHITCLSNLSLSAHLGHFGASTALTIACKNILINSNGGNLSTSNQEIPKHIFDSLIQHLERSISQVVRFQGLVRNGVVDLNESDGSMDCGETDLDLYDVLRKVPNVPLHCLADADRNQSSLAMFLRSIAHTEWLIKMLGCILRHFSNAGNDIFSTNSGYSEYAFQSESFKNVLTKIGKLYSHCMLEAGRVRTESGYDDREQQRRQNTNEANGTMKSWFPSAYILRIVCQDGAIVRDGIEIDSCQSVGNLEMGEIVTATDRCINASGVMRYKLSSTDELGIGSRWVSELTRGHGREPIAEVIRILHHEIGSRKENVQSEDDGYRRINVGVLDLRSAGASVLGRMHGAHKGIVSSLSKCLSQNRSVTRSLWGRSPESVTVTAQNFAICEMLCGNFNSCFNFGLSSKKDGTNTSDLKVTSEKSLYIAGVLDILQHCLFEEKRERKSVNSFLLIGLLESSQILSCSSEEAPTKGFLGAVNLIFEYVLATLSKPTQKSTKQNQRPMINRVVAASIVPALSFIHKLASHQIASNLKPIFQKYENMTERYPTTNDFVRHINSLLGELCLELCKDERLVCLPTHILHPILSFVSDILKCLKASSETLPVASSISTDTRSTAAGGSGLLSQGLRRIAVPAIVPAGELPSMGAQNIVGGLNVHNLPGGLNIFLGGGNSRALERFHISLGGNGRVTEPFQPSDESVSRLVDMGFSRDHALQALEETETNQVEVAMEYALTHPPPSPATAERRRIQREARAAAASRERAQREEQQQQQQQQQQEQQQQEQEQQREDQSNTINDGLPENQDNSSASNAVLDRHETTSNLGIQDESKIATNQEVDEDIQIVRLKQLRSTLYTQVVMMVLLLVEGKGENFKRCQEDANFSGQKEGEGIVVVVANFFLEAIGRPYQSEVPCFIWDTLNRLHFHFKNSRILPNHELQVASLCHFLTIILRALPLMRQLVLRKGLCSVLIKSLKHASEKNSLGGSTPWIPNMTLLLGLLAQPTLSPLNNPVDVKNVDFINQGRRSEFHRCCGEHKKQAAILNKITEDMCAIVHGRNPGKKIKPDGKKSEDNQTKIPQIPTYAPILPWDELESCVHLCHRFLSKIKDLKFEEEIGENPGIVHSILYLLLHVIRSHRLAMVFLRMGGCELILALPSSSKFVGKTGLITAILIHLLEDEHTLRQSMETEIRISVTRLHKKQSHRGSNESTKISSASFIQAIAPLICRDPIVFVKAAATTIATEPNPSGSNSFITLLNVEERSKNSKALASYFGIQNSAHFPGPTCHRLQNKGNLNKSRAEGTLSRSKRKALDRKNKKAEPKSPKKLKKSNKDDTKDLLSKSSFMILNGTPANHVTSLLLSNLIVTAENELKNNGETIDADLPFISLVDYLDIVADLVLAIPACAAAIHRYRALSGTAPYNRLNNMHHAIIGCSPPPGTAVGYLLHYLLPMVRKLPSKRAQCARERDTVLLREKRHAYFHVQVAQKSARLLVILCARAGEGRRRVVADLAAALGAETKEGLSEHKKKLSSTDDELWALRSWGELCIGLSAPRSSGINQDSDNTLSWEVVRLMLEFNIPQTLLKGIDRVDLKVPMASDTIAAMLRPLEVFSRGSVSDTIDEMVRAQSEKDEDNKIKASSKGTKNIDDSKAKQKDSSRRTTIGPSQRSEGAFADDAMLGDGFMPEDADRARRNAQRRMVDDIVDLHEYVNDDDDEDLGLEIESNDDEDDDEIESDESEDEDLEVRLGNPDDFESDGSSNESEDDDVDDNDDLMSQSEESDNASSAESDSTDSDIQMMDDDMVEIGDIDESIDDDADEDDNEEDSWDGHDEEDEDFFDELPDDGDDAIVPSESEIDDGWTRIDSGGVPADRGGGIFFLRQQGTGGDRLRAGDAVGGMNVLRNILNGNEIGGLNDASMDALAEIEETLGIRLQNRGNSTRRFTGASLGSNIDDDPLGSIGGLLGGLVNIVNSGNNSSTVNTQSEIGTRPTVTQSDFSLQTVSGGGFSKGGQFSSIDYVYGGVSDIFAFYACQPTSQDQAAPIPSSYDTQLFPLGPAAATHSKTRQFLHPLLCDLNLAPINTIVSTMESHGERSRDFHRADTSAQSSSAARLSNFSVRLNRGSDGIPFIEHTNLLGSHASVSQGGNSRWLDDGQPLDSSTIGFTESFERALSANMAINLAEQQQDDEIPTLQHNDVEAGSNLEIASSAEEIRQDDTAQEMSSQNINNPENQEEAVSEGEAVASTLAAELTLASRSDSSISMEDGNTQVGEQVELSSSQIEGETYMNDRQEERSNGMEVDNNGTNNPIQNEISEGTDNPGNAEVDSNENGLVCPPGMDLEVFNSLPTEMQQEVVDEHRSMANLASQIDASSGLDPEALAALPDDMRREIIAQQQTGSQSAEPPADPSNAEEMDNASFLASLTPDLRAEILLTSDNDFLSSLPPSIVAEAQLLRDRAASRHQAPIEMNTAEPSVPATSSSSLPQESEGTNISSRPSQQANVNPNITPRNSRSDRRNRSGHIRVDRDRSDIVYQFSHETHSGPFDDPSSLATLVRLFYMLSPVRPHRLLQKLFMNMSANAELRKNLLTVLMSLLQGDNDTARSVVNLVENHDELNNDSFPPTTLIGSTPDPNAFEISGPGSFRRRNINATTASIAANIPTSARIISRDTLPPIVARRVVECLSVLSKNGRVALEILESSVVDDNARGPEKHARSLDCLLDLLCLLHYTQSSTNLDQLLHLLEIIVNVLSVVPKAGEEEQKILKSNIASAASAGKEWIRVPRPVVDQHRIKLLCSVLRLEACKDTSFHKVNQIIRRLCRIEENRIATLRELAFVAQGLGVDATRDLKSLNISLVEAMKSQRDHNEDVDDFDKKKTKILPASAVTLSTSSSELKLLRVLQTVHSLCDDVDDSNRKVGQIRATSSDELSSLFKAIDFESLWDELGTCLKVVSVLQGVNTEENDDDGGSKDDENPEQDAAVDDIEGTSKKLPASVAGLLTRFLPAIEAFFVVNASQIGIDIHHKTSDSASEGVTGSERLIKFVCSNKILLNALVRANPSLLEKGLKAMVEVPQCRPFIDFDVKRHWFKSQMRRLRQSASRRYGSLRLNIRRKNVFEDAFYQLHLRTGEEMRGRLHITFSDEEGVDAGGLSREFFEILAKEMFNPNYALFTSTEDGCTFQPNPNSSFVNPDHLSHFRFVGRIVGKALADGFLLDAHFTRSLYKHMLGIKPTHHDMEAIDPDFYKNLKMILEYNLEDIGLDHLSFSTEDNSFGRSRVIDLIPGGRSITVTEENKEKYVSHICQYRMTTSIEPQIKAYLEGFYEMIKKDFIYIFNAKELELLISGLPDIDIFDLQKNTEYTNYKATDQEILWFWEVMHSLSRSQKAAFLQFVTGSAKVPLEGFSQLQGMRGTQKFSITKASGPSGSLMSAHTCFNALELPVYESKDILREKLLYAIAEGQGSFQFA